MKMYTLMLYFQPDKNIVSIFMKICAYVEGELNSHTDYLKIYQWNEEKKRLDEIDLPLTNNTSELLVLIADSTFE